MRLRAVLLLVILGSTAVACSNLGVGEADCTPPSRGFSGANILMVQAVPTAIYTPCINELRLGWSSIHLFAESDRAGIEVVSAMQPFVTVSVTESCDVSNATQVESGYPDIERYEDVDVESAEINITVIPSGSDSLFAARNLIEELEGIEINDRPVRYTFDDNVEQMASSRVERALRADHYVWIISELDAEEGTLELRSNRLEASHHAIEPDDAFELIEDSVSGVHYLGNWYYTFEGGCITYEFDAKGVLAETVAADVEDAFGFYPAYEVRDIARDAGFDIDAG